MGITTTQAETAIYSLIGAHDWVGIDKKNIRHENEALTNGKPFVAPTDAPHCKIFFDYSISQPTCITDKVNVRDFGVMSIQCFTPKNSGTITMSNLCEQWRTLLQSFSIPFLEVYLVHAPQNLDDQNFYGKIIKAEFRIN